MPPTLTPVTAPPPPERGRRRARPARRPRAGRRHRRRARARHRARRARRRRPPGARLAGRHRRRRPRAEAVHGRLSVGGLRRHRRRPARRQPRPARGRPARVGAPHRGLARGAALRRVGRQRPDRRPARRGAAPSLAITMAVRRHGRDVPLEPRRARRGLPAGHRRPGGLPARSRRDRRGLAAAAAGRPAAATATGWPPSTSLDPGLPARQHRPADRRERRRPGRAARRPGGAPGRPPYAGSRWSGTRWAASSCGPPARSCTDAPTRWNDLVTDVVTLGTPHLGAPLERGVALGARALGLLPESAPFGRILEYRSVGILDLRGGLAPDVQNLPHARYHLVAATLAALPPPPGERDARRPAGALPVRDRPAAPRARRCSPAPTCCTSGATTSTCSTIPRSYDALRAWLS